MAVVILGPKSSYCKKCITHVVALEEKRWSCDGCDEIFVGLHVSLLVLLSTFLRRLMDLCAFERQEYMESP
jgi:hypothetical protein